MEDAQIIDHFFRRDPEALRAAQELSLIHI